MLSVLHSQYHACWFSDDFMSQGISRHGIDPPNQEYFISSIKRVNGWGCSSPSPQVIIRDDIDYTRNRLLSSKLFQWSESHINPGMTVRYCYKFTFLKNKSAHKVLHKITTSYYLYKKFHSDILPRIWETNGNILVYVLHVCRWSNPILSYCHYRKTSSISRTKSQSLNVSCILLQLPSLNPLKPGVKLTMKM